MLRRTLLSRYVGIENRANKKASIDKSNSEVSRSQRSSIFSQNGQQQLHHHVVGGPGNILLSRAMMTLSEVQCHLDKQGASNLVVELIIQNPNQHIFLRSVELGIALLEGGNPVIQQSMLSKLNLSNNAEKFFKVFHEKMTAAQQTIKSSVSVATTELIGNKRPSDETAAAVKNKATAQTRGLVLTDDLKNQIWDAAFATTRAYHWIKKLGASIVSSSEKRKAEKKESPSMVVTPDDPRDSQTSRSSLSLMENDLNDFSDGSLTPSKSGIRTTSNGNAIHAFDSSSSHGASSEDDEKLPKEVIIMRPILRFLQLLCENHNLELQNFLRHQSNKNNYNMVSETLKFLDCICGSTTGGLGLLGLYINEKNVSLVNQTLETLTEYCQGPCHENQNCIAMHESNAIDIIIALILNDINPLGKTRMDLVLSLKNNASKLLLAIMESRGDSGNAERIMYNMSAKQLIDAACNAFHQNLVLREEMDEYKRTSSSSHNITAILTAASSNSATTMEDSSDDEDEGEVTPKEVGHNIYILCHQLAKHNKELAALLKPNFLFDTNASSEVNTQYTKALSYYRKQTAQIEIVRSDRTMEQIVFPVPQACQYLTSESKQKVFFGTERDEQGSKVSDFFSRSTELYNEMKWQRKLRSQPLLYSVSSYMSLWASLSFQMQFFLNFIIALFYPFDRAHLSPLDPILSSLLWILVVASASSLATFKRKVWMRTFLLSIITRSIFTFGIESTLVLLGIANVLLTGVHLISIMGNRGTFTKSVFQILTDTDIVYHVIFWMFGILGLCIHPLFYSVLLLHVVYSEETLRNVIRSVTRNGRSIILTAILAVILIYLFSIIGYLFFRNDFIMEIDSSSPADKLPVQEESPASCIANSSCAQNITEEKSKYWNDVEVEDGKERWCDTLLMCIITTLNQGLRNGGGIGDVLRSPSSREPLFMARVVYDLLFFFIVIIIILNLIFGVIIDTFADLRSEKQQKEEILRNTCFVCGLERSAFDNKNTSFEEHIRHEHNMWHYLYFIVLVRVKNPTEFTGPESYVFKMIHERNLDWFPRMRAMSLDAESHEEEDSSSHDQIKQYQADLQATQQLVMTLIQQLSELKEQVRILLCKVLIASVARSLNGLWSYPFFLLFLIGQ